jgi:GDPmannose 4,6-dehydratase
VREFLEESFGYVGLDYNKFVRIDPRYFRPTEVDLLLSDPSKANNILKWTPKVKFSDLVRIMMDADLELMGLDCPGEGKKVIKNKFTNWHQWEHQVVSMGK